MPEDEALPSTPESPVSPRVPVRPIVAVAVAIAAAVALATISSRVTDIVGLVAFSLVLTWLTRPLFRRVQRRLGEGAAIALTTVIILAGAGVLLGLLLSDLTATADSLAASIRTSLDTVNGTTTFDRVVRALRLGDSITDWLTNLPGEFLFGINGEPAVGERVVDLTVVVVLSAFIHASAGGIVTGFVRLWRRDEREPVWGLLNDIDRRAGSYLRRLGLESLLWTAALSAPGIALGMPAPVLIAAWAGFWLTIPTLGMLIGLLPLVLTALTLAPWRTALMITAGVAVGVAAVVMRRRTARGLRPGVGVTMIALAVGVAYSGSAAALLVYCLAVIGVCLATSPYQRDVRLPMPEYSEESAYRWGPLVIPRGVTGIVMVAVAIVVAVICWSIIGRSGLTLVWLSLAILFAVAIDRPVDFLQRTLRLGRTTALTITFTLIAAVFTGIGISVVNEGPTSAAKAVQNVPAVVHKLEGAPLVGGWLKEHHAADVVTRQLERLPSLVRRSHGSLNWLPSLGSQLVDVLWILLLTAALVIDGGRIVRAVERRVPALHRRQFRRLADVSHRALAGYAAGSVLICGINGTVVLVLALALQIGLAPVLALWAFLWDFVPQVGGFIGGVPLVLFALVAGPAPFVIATVVYIVYQLVETNILYPAIIGEVIDIPAWAAMVAALVGAAAGGLVGAVVITPLVGVVRLVSTELRRREFPGRQVRVGRAPPATG